MASSSTRAGTGGKSRPATAPSHAAAQQQAARGARGQQHLRRPAAASRGRRPTTGPPPRSLTLTPTMSARGEERRRPGSRGRHPFTRDEAAQDALPAERDTRRRRRLVCPCVAAAHWPPAARIHAARPARRGARRRPASGCPASRHSWTRPSRALLVVEHGAARQRRPARARPRQSTSRSSSQASAASASTPTRAPVRMPRRAHASAP